MKLIIFITNFTSDNMRQTFTKLIATSIILVNSQLIFAKNGPNYRKGFTPKKTNGIAFTENKGQVYDQNYKQRTDVLYGAMAGNMAFHLKTNGVSYQLYRVDKYKEVIDERTKEKHPKVATKNKKHAKNVNKSTT